MTRKRAVPEPAIVEPVDEEDDGANVVLAEMARQQAAVGDIALLDDPTYEEVKWSIWRLRTEQEMRADPNGDKAEYVGTRFGAIESEQFQHDFGGGTFDLRGYVQRFDALGNKRGMVVRYRPKCSIAGPRKNFAEVPITSPVTTVLGAPAPSSTDRLLEELLRQQQQQNQDKIERLLEKILAHCGSPTAAT